MGSGYAEEKIFNEQLDLLLAGKDLSSKPEMDGDMLTALDFARLMKEMRPEPSPAFQSNLKVRLTEKLQEQEQNSRQGWFWKLIPREPIWQAAAVLAIMLVVGGVLWGTLLRPNESVYTDVKTPAATTAAPTAPAYYDADTYLAAAANTDKMTYALGENVKIEVSLSNVTSQTLILEQYPPILSLMQSESGQPVYTFAAGKIIQTLMPGESTDFILNWDQKDAQGRSATPGDYYLELENLELPGRSVQLKLTQPVIFNISPEAAVNESSKIINVNQSQTINGITVTVRRLELTDKGVIISAFVTPPADYQLLQGTPVLSASVSYQASAGYAIDGEWIKDIGVSAVEYFAEGMNHTWYIPDPVPAEAQEMTFIVNTVGQWSGPWEFEVSLQ
jgi:hypothetical protein